LVRTFGPSACRGLSIIVALKNQAVRKRAYSISTWQSVAPALHWRFTTCTTDCPAYPYKALDHTWALRKRDAHVPDSLIRQLFRVAG
jgi:hypothetical protein